MKITFDCIPCIVSHIVHIAKKVTDDDTKRHHIITRTMAEALKANLAITPPEQARIFHKIVREVTGIADLYIAEKDCSTEFALELLPFLRNELQHRTDYFESVVRLVIGGNIIDYGADRHFDINTAKRRIMEVFDLPIDSSAIKLLKAAMDNAGKIFYIADNCGEAVFDRLLIELYSDKITLGVRGEPILNDITMREVAHSGLDFVPVLHTGDMTPGVSLQHSSREFIAGMRNTDLIISKGQGNFESLNDYDRPIFFLFRVKCNVIADMVGVEGLGSLQIITQNIC